MIQDSIDAYQPKTPRAHVIAAITHARIKKSKGLDLTPEEEFVHTVATYAEEQHEKWMRASQRAGHLEHTNLQHQDAMADMRKYIRKLEQRLTIEQ